ncbi:hypothetical protein [Janthinobacterium sp. J1-1]|uniref:hypothetical protein n=1 Tax=Janthinobacterium sp. J1-1 TaxID=3065910 RepID=UPI00281217A2|nr:hypothetical protein [Janthinobacterium sp. J1-1]
MSALINDRDVLIQGTVPRYSTPLDRALMLTPSATMFEVSVGGVPIPETITFSALMLGAVGAITFSSEPAVPLTVTNGNAVLSYADMAPSIVTVTATTVIEGVTYRARQTVAKQQALDLTPPPTPTGLVATGHPATITLAWHAVVANYNNLSHTEVWRAPVNNFAQAVLAGRADGREYTDPVGPGAFRYYWIRYVSRAAIPGPYNASSGTVGASDAEVEHLLQVLTDEITRSQLHADLGAKIDLIEPTRDAVADLEVIYGDTASAAASAAQAVQAAADAALKAAAADAAAGGASQYASQANLSATTASTAAGAASTSAGQSSQAATAAGGSAAAAESAASTAANAAGAAGASASAASTSKDTAAGSATAAGVQAAASSQSAIEAKAARDAASGSASAALQSAGSASASSTAAGGAASQAATSAELAVGAKNTATGAAASASQSAGAAGTAETNAAGSASQAASSAQLAAASNTAAGGSAAAAAGSASTAGTKSTEAGQAATAASQALLNAGAAAGAAGDAATAAGQSAGQAGASANAASLSAQSAAGKATDAGSSAEAARVDRISAEAAYNQAAGAALAASGSAQTADARATVAGQSATAANNAATTAGTAAGQAGSYLQQVAQSATNADGSAQAAASYLLQAQATLKDPITGLVTGVAAVKASGEATADSVEGLKAKYSIKMDVGGIVGGLELLGGGDVIDFAVHASIFSIAAPAGSGIAAAVPFIVRTTETVVGGVTIPIGVYIANAFIQNASITNAKIGGDIWSSNYSPGQAGWYLNRAGDFYANSVRLRGAITGGAFTEFAWPTGAGFYLGPEGLRLGDIGSGKYFHVSADGQIYAPGLTIINGAATFGGVLSAVTGTFQLVRSPGRSGPAGNAGSGAGYDQTGTGLYFYDGVNALPYIELGEYL